MKHLSKAAVFTVVLLLSLGIVHAWGGHHNHKKVLIRDVQAVTLRNGLETTGRRSSPVPQIKCVGGRASGKFEPDVVQCINRGMDGIDAQWECTTHDMPKKYRFGETNLYCEGWAYPEDPYILAGSCGLEYTLEYTNPEDDDSWFSSWGRRRAPTPPPVPVINHEWSWFKTIAFWIAAFFFVTWCCGCCSGSRRHNSTEQTIEPPATTTQPGFWTGAAVGATGGYFAGRRHWYNPFSWDWHPPSGGWHHGGHSWRSSSRSSSSSSRSSSGRHSSSGFGGTRRR